MKTVFGARLGEHTPLPQLIERAQSQSKQRESSLSAAVFSLAPSRFVELSRLIDIAPFPSLCASFQNIPIFCFYIDVEHRNHIYFISSALACLHISPFCDLTASPVFGILLLTAAMAGAGPFCHFAD